MSSSKSKYDWDVHLPQMRSLYLAGMSVPEICKAIQSEATGFTPGQSIVYQKLRSAGYPTEKKHRAKVLRDHELSRQLDFGTSTITPEPRPMHRNSFSEHQNHENSDFAFDPPTSIMHTQQPLMTNVTVDPSILKYSSTSNVPYELGLSASLTNQNILGYADIPNSQGLGAASGIQWTADLPVVQRQNVFGVDPNIFTTVTQTAQTDRNLLAQSALFDNQEWLYNNTTLSTSHGRQQDAMTWDQDRLSDNQVYDSCTSTEQPNTSKLSLPTEAGIPEKEDDLMASTPRRVSTAETQLEIITFNLPKEDRTVPSATIEGDDVLMSTPVNLIGEGLSIQTDQNDTPNSHDPRITPSPTDSSTFGGRMMNVTRRARSGLMYMIKRDSGYASGRNSPLALSVEDTRPDPSSLLEFKGLHRVPCQRLHQPPPIDTFYIPGSKTMERFKETPTCSQCQYSSIHNLSWSAQYLGLAVFKAELKLDTKYNIAALDKAGNSALHYAASGGAGFEHFAALIHAGVDPCQINTAGQLFLHCLRPHIREIGTEGFDDKLVTGFHTDLVDLLNEFQPRGAFRWRDNEGSTVLDALASNISNVKLRAQTFHRIKDAGFSLEISSQYPTRTSSRSQSNEAPSTKAASFAAAQDRQRKAYDILGRASMEPSYVDPDTGDNVLHALARLKPGGSLLSKIQEFVLKDIDLNLHNRDRDCPLAAFISERPFLGKHNDETGATMSKYLDALLWKDARCRIPNRINVNMRNREGVTALYYAAMRARPDSVRSLIEAGANVNARQYVDGDKISILRATMNAKAQAVLDKDDLKVKDFENVISYLEHENAVVDPSLFEERAVCENSVRIMPL
ncbi:hypothetical protein N431DRAFT_333696 [Stipitochalara longipes BDJ]|nr:hypothetical protein N431DRAFT_333696 [Stipitochalara longipes BDJ]